MSDWRHVIGVSEESGVAQRASTVSPVSLDEKNPYRSVLVEENQRSLGVSDDRIRPPTTMWGSNQGRRAAAMAWNRAGAWTAVPRTRQETASRTCRTTLKRPGTSSSVSVSSTRSCCWSVGMGSRRARGLVSEGVQRLSPRSQRRMGAWFEPGGLAIDRAWSRAVWTPS